MREREREKERERERERERENTNKKESRAVFIVSNSSNGRVRYGRDSATRAYSGHAVVQSTPEPLKIRRRNGLGCVYMRKYFGSNRHVGTIWSPQK